MLPCDVFMREVCDLVLLKEARERAIGDYHIISPLVSIISEGICLIPSMVPGMC
jgi:hypothetical protein